MCYHLLCFYLFCPISSHSLCMFHYYELVHQDYGGSDDNIEEAIYMIKDGSKGDASIKYTLKDGQHQSSVSMKDEKMKQGDAEEIDENDNSSVHVSRCVLISFHMVPFASVQ